MASGLSGLDWKTVVNTGFTPIVDLPILLLFATITRAVIRPSYSD
jgi:hypothetical protein